MKQPVTPAMAVRLGKFGNGPDVWLNLQRDCAPRTLQPTMDADLAAIALVEV